MKRFLLLLLAGSCGLIWAQTNAPATNPPKQQIIITSDSGSFDANKGEMIYAGHVLVTDNPQATMQCGRLTVDVPMDGGHPTNIVAETNVVIVVLYKQGQTNVIAGGQTNVITADKAVYAYSVLNSVTNETITFTGGQPKVENPQFTVTGDPLVWDNVAKKFSGQNFHQSYNLKAGNGTNASPLDFMK